MVAPMILAVMASDTSIRDQRAAAFDAADLHPDQQGCGRILQVIVVMVSEIWNICIAQTLKMIVLIFDNQTANDQRYPDIAHLENIAGNYLVGLSLDSSPSR